MNKIRGIKVNGYEFTGYVSTDDMRETLLEELGIYKADDLSLDLTVRGELGVNARYQDDIQLDSIEDVIVEYNGKVANLIPNLDYSEDDLDEDLSEGIWSSSFDYYTEQAIARADFAYWGEE